jgi:membrane associated rhomboid family serine protease
LIGLNHIFLFLALVTPIAILFQCLRLGRGYREWQIPAVIVLAITGAAWILFRNKAGYIGAVAWALLLFIPTTGLRRVSDLFARQRFKSARRLAVVLYGLHPSAELRNQIRLFRTFESRQAAGLIPAPSVHSNGRSMVRFSGLRKAPAVIAFIVLNVVAFLIEFRSDPSIGAYVLHRLGALEPQAVINGEYWRLLTALFLHGGWVHLLFNLFALYVLGPPLERSIGTFRFCVCYLISGLGSTAGVVALTFAGIIQSAQLIGASGSVMGIVGAWAGYLLRHRHIPMVRRRLENILMIVIIQTAFDVTTREVSMSAHLCGLAVGFVVGLIIAPDDHAKTGPSYA